MTELAIRSAARQDAGLMPGFISQLADHEKPAHEVEAAEAQLAENPFGGSPQSRPIGA